MTAKKPITKKEYEELLNKAYGVDLQKWGNGKHGAAKRPYGTYLRSQDREKFNLDYAEYLKTGAL